MCLGHASVMMISDPLKLSSPKPAFWAPYTWAGGREQLALGSDLGPALAQAKVWCPLGLCCRDNTQDPAVFSSRHKVCLQPASMSVKLQGNLPAPILPLGARKEGGKCAASPQKLMPTPACLQKHPISHACHCQWGFAATALIPTRDSVALSLLCRAAVFTRERFVRGDNFPPGLHPAFPCAK